MPQKVEYRRAIDRLSPWSCVQVQMMPHSFGHQRFLTTRAVLNGAKQYHDDASEIREG